MLANVAIMNNTPAIVAAVGIIGCHSISMVMCLSIAVNPQPRYPPV